MKIYSLSGPDLYKNVHADFEYKPGIYRLHVQSEGEHFERIQRLLDADDQGILYIGTSVSLTYRITSLVKSVSAAYGEGGFEDPGAHQCGKKIVRSPKFRERFPLKVLCLTIESCRQDDDEVGYQDGDHTKLEWKKLEDYFSRFGEYPPLNG